MDTYWLIVFFIFGAVFGSFYNVVGLRVPKGLSFHADRSNCTTCDRQLSWIELIPVVSYVFLRGKCRGCKSKISPIYPVTELSTGILFAFSFWYFGFTPELITALLFSSMAIILIVTDLTYMLIPNKILLFFLPLFIVMRVISPLDPWYDALIGAVVGYIVLAVIILVSKGGMGGGDMKLFAVLGVILGWKATLLTLFLGALLGLLIGGFIMIVQKKGRKQPIPFGPYILIAALLSYFYGDAIISVYLGFFSF